MPLSAVAAGGVMSFPAIYEPPVDEDMKPLTPKCHSQNLVLCYNTLTILSASVRYKLTLLGGPH